MTSTSVNLKAAKEAIADLTKAYVPAEEKVLDPTLIDKPLGCLTRQDGVF